jgi:excinuclease UvrABC ATPase subunit
MAHADRIIDLGPGAGHDGGLVVFEGTPAELVADPSTLTGKHLAAYVGG